MPVVPTMRNPELNPSEYMNTMNIKEPFKRRQ